MSSKVAVAKVVNGVSWLLLKTPAGLRFCLEKYKEEESKWIPTATLTDFVESVRCGKNKNILIQASLNPNEEKSRTIKFKSYYEFVRSGFDLINTGSLYVRVSGIQ